MESLKNVKIGFALTGSFCTFEKVMPSIEALVKAGSMVYPIMSRAAYNMDTRFGEAVYWRERIKCITGTSIIHTINGAEPIGPQALFDLIVVAPCTGNSLAKLANGITDTPVTMACKAHWRNNGPVLIAISTNDGLGINLKNIGSLLPSKNVYFVPFGQDNPHDKEKSLVADMQLLVPAIVSVIKGKQIQPIMVQY